MATSLLGSDSLQPFEKLEHELGVWCGRPGNVAVCNSGTAALHLALETLRLPKFSEVIVPNYTMISCARAVTMAGLEPVFIGCKADDYCIDVDQLEDQVKKQPRVKAIMAVHVYGRQCDMDKITSVAGQYDLKVIEDLAEAHGIDPHKDTDVACWSFYKNKIICGEEGGACAFKYNERTELAKQLRSVGFTAAHDYTHIPRGHNYRLANCLAQQILNSLHSFNKNLKERKAIEEWYIKETPLPWLTSPRKVPWVYDIRIPGLTDDQQYEIVMALNVSGINARHGFKPMNKQAEYVGCWAPANDPYPNLERLEDVLAREVVYLPIKPGFTFKEDVIRTFEIIKDVVW